MRLDTVRLMGVAQEVVATRAAQAAQHNASRAGVVAVAPMQPSSSSHQGHQVRWCMQGLLMQGS